MIDYEKIAEGVEMPTAEPSSPSSPSPAPSASSAPSSASTSRPARPSPPNDKFAAAATTSYDSENLGENGEPTGNPPTGATFDTSTVFEDPRPATSRADREFLPLTHQKYQGIAEQKGYKQDDFSGHRLQKVRYTHEAMIDVIIAEPTITQNELAKRFERSVSWVSIIMGSDAFQAALAKRRDDLTDPFLIATIEERFRGLAQQSLQIIAQNLEKTQNTDLALKALDISSKALGFGARAANSSQTTNNFVVQLPPKAADSDAWAKGRIIDQ